MNKKGLSEIVTTLLFVLLALGAVLLVWTLVKTQITQSGAQLGVEKACLDLNLEVSSCVINTTAGTVRVLYSRGSQELAGELSLSKVSVILENPDGTTKTMDVTGVPSILETKAVQYTIAAQLAGITPVKAGIAAALLTESGSESSCTESARKNCVTAS